MNDVLQNALAYARPHLKSGKLADYIPALTSADPSHLGVSVATTDGKFYHAGDTEIPFSAQSISKVFALAYVLKNLGTPRVLDKVGLEPSGNPFYSLVQLEYESGKPRNPFINAGAIAITSLIPGDTGREKFEPLRNFVRDLADEPSLDLNETVYRSEFDTSHRNRALGHFMKHFGIIEGSVMESVDAYFRQCALAMTCRQLARSGLFLAHRGVKNSVLTEDQVRLINALMTTCGLYDASGEFAIRGGIPAKSGVGGGILAVVPGRMTIAAFGPALDEKGNSVGALKILEFLSQKWALSVF